MCDECSHAARLNKFEIRPDGGVAQQLSSYDALSKLERPQEPLRAPAVDAHVRTREDTTDEPEPQAPAKPEPPTQITPDQRAQFKQLTDWMSEPF